HRGLSVRLPPLHRAQSGTRADGRRAGRLSLVESSRQRLGDNDPVLTSHPLFLSLAASAEERREVYRRMFGQPVPEGAIKAIRDATQFEWALGDIAFRERAEARTGRRADRLPTGRPRTDGERKSRLSDPT